MKKKLVTWILINISGSDKQHDCPRLLSQVYLPKGARTGVVLCEEFMYLMRRIPHTPVEIITSVKLQRKFDGETNKTKQKIYKQFQISGQIEL